MNVTKLNADQLIHKWKSILITKNIPEKYHLNVAFYVEILSIMETVNTLSSINNRYTTLVPLNIEIISKIIDLSKVYFMDKPAQEILGKYIQVSEVMFKCDLTLNDLQYLELTDDIVKYNVFSDRIVEKITNRINKEIEEGKNIYIYNLCQTLNILKDNSNSDLPIPILTIVSRFAAI